MSRVTAVVDETNRKADYLCARIEGGDVYVTMEILDSVGKERRPRRRDVLEWEAATPHRVHNAQRDVTYRAQVDNDGLSMGRAREIVRQYGGRTPSEPRDRV